MDDDARGALLAALAAVAKLAGAAVAAWWGGLHVLVQVLIGLMALDIASGLIAACVSAELSSEVSYRGVARKALILLIVAAAAWLEPATGLPAAQAVAGFYAVHEALSILENAARAGVPVPPALHAALARLEPPDGAPDQRPRRRPEEGRRG